MSYISHSCSNKLRMAQYHPLTQEMVHSSKPDRPGNSTFPSLCPNSSRTEHLKTQKAAGKTPICFLHSAKELFKFQETQFLINNFLNCLTHLNAFSKM